MNVKALEIKLGGQRIGVLFQYAPEGAAAINRFVADDAFIGLRHPPTLSLSFQADVPENQALLWRDIHSAPFNGALSKDGGSWFLPPFFQNLLPEGVFREQIAHARHCAANDHFEILAACGNDLPGNVYALPLDLTRQQLGHYITQDADALEMTVSAEPMEQGVSLSGFQPKLGVIRQGDRYVGRTKDQDTHIIAKLPVMAYPLLPEVEALSLRLARAAGVAACDAYLVPLSQLAAQHHYELGDMQAHTRFLAVPRYDRAAGRQRIHCEDFAQVFGVMPEDKYSPDYSYLGVAATFLAYPSLGQAAVHELLRRIVVNEMLGNADMHLKNIGIWYPDGKTPRLPPTYDIVAHSIYTPVAGHGLRILPENIEARLPARDAKMGANRARQLTPAVVRAFCEALGIPEKPAANAIAKCVKAATSTWPGLIHQSALATGQKNKLLAWFEKHPMVSGVMRRTGQASSLSAHTPPQQP
jgi:serine/threonine-protein kinase HipA